MSSQSPIYVTSSGSSTVYVSPVSSPPSFVFGSEVNSRACRRTDFSTLSPDSLSCGEDNPSCPGVSGAPVGDVSVFSEDPYEADTEIYSESDFRLPQVKPAKSPEDLKPSNSPSVNTEDQESNSRSLCLQIDPATSSPARSGDDESRNPGSLTPQPGTSSEGQPQVNPSHGSPVASQDGHSELCSGGSPALRGLKKSTWSSSSESSEPVSSLDEEYLAWLSTAPMSAFISDACPMDTVDCQASKKAWQKACKGWRILEERQKAREKELALKDTIDFIVEDPDF